MSEDSTDIHVNEVELQNLVSTLLRIPIISSILEDLKNNLPGELQYHSESHTKEVIREALRLGLIDKLKQRELELLTISAAFHDAGFLSKNIDNEEIAADMASKAMSLTQSYSKEEIDLVRNMILDTKLTYRLNKTLTPSSPLSDYLLDADLSNFGRVDFFEKLELARVEFREEPRTFYPKTLVLLKQHQWLTKAASKIWGKQKCLNELCLEVIIAALEKINVSDIKSERRLEIAAKLPLLLNSSLEVKKVIQIALQYLKKEFDAEAGTLFLKDRKSDLIRFWALEGAEKDKLEGRTIEARQGIVGWVIDKREATLVTDTSQDPRFLKTVDKETSFVTRNMICVPLIARGKRVLGAMQVLNKISGTFNQEDLDFLDHCGQQVALALENALLYEELNEQHQLLKKLDAKKNEVIAVIAHEFKTPLNIIQGSAELLSGQRELAGEVYQKTSSTLMNGVQRLIRIVGEINNLAVVAKKEIKTALTDVNINIVFNTLMEHFGPIAKNRNLTLRFSCDNERLNVKADPALFALALNNLISNSIRFTPDGGSISVRAQEASAGIKISVEDTGIGIAPEEIPLLCEKFYEVAHADYHQSGTYQFKSAGLGLGLSTVKEILSAFDSQLMIESKLGEGSSFSFILKS